MPGEPDFAREQQKSWRWWFLPSWLAFDSPAVAWTWAWTISRNTDSTLSFRPIAAMCLVVWSIYSLDRLIDVARCRDWRQATGRLRFGRRYRPYFLVCFGLGISGIVALLLLGLPGDVVRRGACVAIALGLHFLLFVVPVFFRDKLLGKEFSVGVFFALAVYACLGYRAGMLPLLIATAMLIDFNCLVIAAKDADNDRANDPGGASRWWRTLNRDLLWGGAGMTIAVGCAAIAASETAFYLSIATGFLCLTALHRFAQKFSGDTVRALADFALFTPLFWNAVSLARQASRR